ncbi:MAG: hypothetical protein NT154_11340 [Verrucomicrobia bacterium]|nr:hypothetical protein [Verrucomicrobiota bacterium]
MRDALAVAATATLVEPGSVLLGRAQGAERQLQSLRLGGPAFANSEDPEALALAHRKLGYRAAYCPSVALKDTDRIRAISEAFAKQDVVIAEVGRWCNLLDADPEKRRQNLETVTEGLALAEAIGARCCVDIAGSLRGQLCEGSQSGGSTRLRRAPGPVQPGQFAGEVLPQHRTAE